MDSIIKAKSPSQSKPLIVLVSQSQVWAWSWLCRKTLIIIMLIIIRRRKRRSWDWEWRSGWPVSHGRRRARAEHAGVSAGGESSRLNSDDESRATPLSFAAMLAGVSKVSGGKIDDITVVVGLVISTNNDLY